MELDKNNNKKYRVLSLFDGISCGRVAIERANIPIECYYASEVDKDAIKISEHNYKDIIHIGDVRDIDNDKLKDLGPIDLLIGGSPCTNFTFSGKRQGCSTVDGIKVVTLKQYMELKKQGYEFDGYSYLFWEYVRILNELKPKYFLLENVKMAQEWEDVITDALGVKPIRINSSHFSAQRRDRLYWCNWLNVLDLPTDLSLEDLFKVQQIDEINKLSKPCETGLLLKDIVRKEDDIEKYQLTKKHMEGFIKNYEWGPNKLTEKSKPLLASYYKQPPHCPYIPSEFRNENSSGYRRLSPIECERLQTLPDEYTKVVGVSDTQRYKTLGNGWTVDVIKYILEYLPI